MGTQHTDHPKPLDVVILYSGGHLGSTYILNKLLKMPEYRVIGIIKAQPVRSLKKSITHILKMGPLFAWLVAWQRIIQCLGFAVTLALPFLKNRLRPAWKIALDGDIPLLDCTSINNSESETFIREHNPDLLISACFPQIIKPNIINLPKQGILNIHPGWLPDYKGAMSYFWVLKNRSREAGVTVHWIDEGSGRN